MGYNDNSTVLRFCYYPAVEDISKLTPGQLRCCEHTDFGSLTLLFNDDKSGLQVNKIRNAILHVAVNGLYAPVWLTTCKIWGQFSPKKRKTDWKEFLCVCHFSNRRINLILKFSLLSYKKQLKDLTLRWYSTLFGHAQTLFISVSTFYGTYSAILVMLNNLLLHIVPFVSLCPWRLTVCV